jgi:hypothetical protein
VVHSGKILRWPLTRSDLCGEDIDLYVGRGSNPSFSLRNLFISLTELSWLFTHVTASNDTDLLLSMTFYVLCRRMVNDKLFGRKRS